jgi:hypothetical protein
MSLIELAKNGDTKAISQLLNKALNPQGITAKVDVENDKIIVSLDSKQSLKQPELVRFIYKGLRKLNTLSYTTLVISGKRIDQENLEWIQELSLNPPTELNKLSNIPETQQYQIVHVNNIAETGAIIPVNKNAQTPSVVEIATLSKSAKYLQKISHIIIIFLSIVISLQGLFIIYTLFISLSRILYTLVSITDITGILSSWIEQLLQIIYEFWDFLKNLQSLIEKVTYLFLLIWVYFINATVKKIFPDYPITPWGGVLRFSIPGYNLWGVWDVLSTLSSYLIKQETEVATKGEKIKQHLPWLYTSIFSYMLVYIIYFIYASMKEENYITSVLYLMVDIMFICRSILYLQIIKISYKAVLLKSGTFQKQFN